MAGTELLRLTSLFVNVFEIGARKAEQDIGDEICRRFGISLEELENRFRSAESTGLTDEQQQHLREEVTRLLAERVPSPAALMTVVAKSGAKFLEMVNEIYSLLSQHDATTEGPAEKFSFRKKDVDLDLVLSRAFLEHVRLLYQAVAQVETGSIDEKKLGDLLAVDGDFYGHWPIQPNALKSGQVGSNLARGITHLVWLRDELNRRPADFGEAKQPLRDAFAAAQRFVDEAMFLVEARVDALTLATSESDPAGERNHDENEDYRARARLAEQNVFREHGLLRSGLYPATFGISGERGSRWLHVDVSQLIGTSNAPGSAPACIKVIDDGEDANLGGTMIGNLACLCGIWKAALQRQPRKDASDGLREALDTRDAHGVTRWLTDLAPRLDAAGRWLRHEVWQSKGTVSREGLFESFEEFLNLPLWRHRWLLYEIWLIATTIRAAVIQGWVCQLHLVKATADTWVLPVDDAAAAPCASLQLPGVPPANIEVWYQDRRPRNGVDMKPDVALETPAPSRRDLVIVEGKDRFRMPTQGKKGVVTVGRDYQQAACAETTWMVNYCPFPDKRLLRPEINHGDAWHELHFASEFKPGNVPDCFIRTIGRSLLPASLRTLYRDDHRPRVLVFVVDTTASMHSHLEQVFPSLRKTWHAFSGKGPFEEYWGLLFGDHDPAKVEPYIVRESGPAADLEQLIESIRRQPLCHGGDEPEALEDAMRACSELGRKLSRPVCFLVFTDAPPHRANDCPSRIDFRQEVAMVLKNGNYCLVVTDWLRNAARDFWVPFEPDRHFRWLELRDIPHLGLAYAQMVAD